MEKTSPQSVAIIVINSEQAALINGSGALNEKSRAFPYGAALCGVRFDSVLVLDRAVFQQERNWLENLIQTRVKPGGFISYAST
jgi:hypothetical protein